MLNVSMHCMQKDQYYLNYNICKKNKLFLSTGYHEEADEILTTLDY
jgi:hypothetical protein